MQHLKKVSIGAISAAVFIILSVMIGSFLNSRIREIDHTRTLRSQMKAQIHASIRSQQGARILETRLVSRCGITAYIVTMLESEGGEYTLYYAIDSGASIPYDLLNGCPDANGGVSELHGDGSASVFNPGSVLAF